MANIEAAIVVFSLIFIIINAACWTFKREYITVCLLFSIFCLSMVGSVVSNMESSGAGAIFDGLMLISGIGAGMALLFKVHDLLKLMMEKVRDYRV